MRRLDVLLSFDHELSLGGARSYAHNLFDPTARLLDVADALGVRVTLFTDVICGMRFYEWDREGFYEPYVEQLRNAVRRGHDVQLHIHPHWADSSHDGTTFHPSESFALGDFAERPPEDPLSIEEIVQRGTAFLTDTCGAVDPDYECVAFRAGGFNMAPATARILQALWDAGIRVDSSIPKDYVFRSGISTVDYTQMPPHANWRIAPGGPLGRRAETGLFEVPVGTRPRTPLNNIPFLVKRVLYRDRAHDPGGLPIHSGRSSPLDVLKRLWPRSAWLLGFDVHTDDVETQMGILEHHIAAHSGAEEIAVSTVSHPKNMGEHSFQLMRDFVRVAREQYGDALDFPTFRALHDRVNCAASTRTPEQAACPTR